MELSKQLFLGTSVAKTCKYRTFKYYVADEKRHSWYRWSSHLETYRLMSGDSQCWWVAFSLNVSSILSIVDWWSFKINLEDFFLSFIFLFSPLEENIQVRGQYENWDFMKEFSKVLLWKGGVKFVILTSALSFWLAFSDKFFTWLL